MSESRLADRIRNGSARVTVIGQGYVGLPLAVEFARAGFNTTGLDTDLDRVIALNAGQSYTPDVDSELLKTVIEAGRYEATSEASTLERSDVVIICVPTPLRKSKDPDISFVVAAAENVAAHFRPGQLVILESTTYPGTTEELLLPMFEARGARIGIDFFLAFSPERIDPANEFSLMGRRLGVNIREVIEAAATKPFGFMPFYPGPGVGGHCIGIDPFYLAWKMRLNGYEFRFLHLADEINRAMPAYVVELVAEALNGRRRCLNGASVLVLGVAYKRGVSDIRESPALEVIAELQHKGALVSYADPHVPSLDVEATVLKSVEVTDQRLATADCVVILTDHADFDYRQIVDASRLVVDTRNATWGLQPPADRVVT